MLIYCLLRDGFIVSNNGKERDIMKKLLVMLLALILVVGCMSAVAEEIDWRALEGGELMMYGGCDEPHVAAVAKAFEEKTGIKVSYIRMSGNDCYNRILEERENPQGDVWYGFSCL